MNPNYDLTLLLQNLQKVEQFLFSEGQSAYQHEVNEARDVIHRQGDWIKKARPALFFMRRQLQEELQKEGDPFTQELQDQMTTAYQLHDGWTPPSTLQVSFDQVNWIDLPYDKPVPPGMHYREKK